MLFKICLEVLLVIISIYRYMCRCFKYIYITFSNLAWTSNILVSCLMGEKSSSSPLKCVCFVWRPYRIYLEWDGVILLCCIGRYQTPLQYYKRFLGNFTTNNLFIEYQSWKGAYPSIQSNLCPVLHHTNIETWTKEYETTYFAKLSTCWTNHWTWSSLILTVSKIHISAKLAF